MRIFQNGKVDQLKNLWIIGPGGVKKTPEFTGPNVSTYDPSTGR